MSFKVLNSEQLYQGKAVNLWREQVAYPDGRQVAVEVIKHPGAVTILPLDDQGRIWFVRQYRHPAGGMLLELPAGTLKPDELPEKTAARELREEIGMAADTLVPLGSFFSAPGYSDEFMHTYLATGLQPSPLSQDAGEWIEVETYPVAEVFAMLARGEIQDAKTLAVLLLARQYLPV